MVKINKEIKIKQQGKDILEDFIDGCSGKTPHRMEGLEFLIGKEEKRVCNCVIENLKRFQRMLPTGEQTRTRKVFRYTIEEFKKKLEKKDLTNCTALKYIDILGEEQEKYVF